MNETSTEKFSEQYGGMFHTRVWAYLFAKEHFSKGDFFMITDASSFLSKKDESIEHSFLNSDFYFSHKTNSRETLNQKLSFPEFLTILCEASLLFVPRVMNNGVIVSTKLFFVCPFLLWKTKNTHGEIT